MNAALLSSATDFFYAPIVAVLAVLAVYFYLLINKKKKEIASEKEEMARRLYELAILKELGERVGYSLNVEEILQIITGSLGQLIDYSAVGYVVLAPEKVKLNIHLEQSVGHQFVSQMKEKIMASLSALTDKNFDQSMVDEVVTGAIIVDELKNEIGSWFNIPLVINGAVAGVLSVAHVKAGLYKEEDMTILYKITGQASEQVSRLQEVVRMEQGKLNAMVESMGDGVLMVDSEYRIVVVNPAVKKIAGFDKEKNVGILDFVDALGGKFDIRGRIEEAVAKKAPYLSEKINISDSFFEIGVYPVLHSLLNKNSQVLGVVVVFHDITRDIELERVREEFTSMIVHELRSPLDGIKKIIELVVSGNLQAGTDKFNEYLNMAHQSSASMLELVNDILDLSKLQAGKFEVKKENANIKEIVENRIMFYKISAESKKLSIQSLFADDLPATCQLDPQAVKQILNNFISNAMKFTSQGGSILVSAFVFKPGETIIGLDVSKFSAFPSASDIQAKALSLCVAVSDTGIGIPEAGMSDLFHTYKQVNLNPVDKESKGTGLGLVIAKGIAEAHGGTVGAVSKEGMGSSFFFTIPLG